MKDNKDKKVVPTLRSLILRIAVGLYLLYTVYMLREALQTNTGMELVFFIAATVIFAILAVILLIHSGYSLINGRYTSGAQNDEEEEPEEDPANEKDNKDE